MTDQDDSIDLRDIVARLWRGRWWLIAAVFLGVAIAALHAWTAAPVYTSEAVISVRSDDLDGPLGMLRGQLSGLASLAGIGVGDSSSRRAEYVAFLKSRVLVKQFVQRYDLMPVLFPSQWDAKAKRFIPGKHGDVPTLGDAIDYVTAVRTVSEDPRTRLLSVSFDRPDPKSAAGWINNYVALANELLRKQAMDTARQSITYLNEELEHTTLDPVRQSLFKLLEGRINQAMLASVDREYAFKVIDTADPPDADKFVRPKRLLELFLGVFLGGIIGAIVALWMHPSRAVPLPGPGARSASG